MRIHRNLLITFSFALLLQTFPSCFRLKCPEGGGMTKVQERAVKAEDIWLPPGFKIEAVATGLTFPTGVAFNDKGDAYVIEAGYSYGEEWTESRLLKINEGATPTVVASGGKNGPWNGISWSNGAFYIAEGGTRQGGRILKVSPGGDITVLIKDLPSVGDHHTNGPVVKDGYIYFCIGTATNSGVVGEDNYKFGWLKSFPEFHDIPCQDITVTGTNYKSSNVFSENGDEQVVTGPYQPFGTPVSDGQIIKGQVPCSGAVIRIPEAGGEPELVAWGLRNPYALEFSPSGKLFVTENGFDVRGSRPVWGTGDVLWEIQEGQWYGWPDYAEGRKVSEYEDFKVPGEGYPAPLLKQMPGTPPHPVATFGVHSSACGFDFAANDSFGSPDEVFIAQYGDMAPEVGKVWKPVGFKIVKTNTSTGRTSDFAVNYTKKNGPATWLKSGGLERPIAVRFDPSGQALYVVDFGILRITEEGSVPVKNTGVIWKITRE